MDIKEGLQPLKMLIKTKGSVALWTNSKSRSSYLINFYQNALLVFDFWMEDKGWIPLTTNAIESAFSRIVNRVKRIGRRWSGQGFINWLMIALRKLYKPDLWVKLWVEYLRIHNQLELSKVKMSYAWI